MFCWQVTGKRFVSVWFILCLNLGFSWSADRTQFPRPSSDLFVMLQIEEFLLIPLHSRRIYIKAIASIN